MIRTTTPTPTVITATTTTTATFIISINIHDVVSHVLLLLSEKGYDLVDSLLQRRAHLFVRLPVGDLAVPAAVVGAAATRAPLELLAVEDASAALGGGDVGIVFIDIAITLPFRPFPYL